MLDETYLLQSYNENESLFSNLPQGRFVSTYKWTLNSKTHKQFQIKGQKLIDKSRMDKEVNVNRKQLRSSNDPLTQKQDEELQSLQREINKNKKETQRKLELLEKLLFQFHNQYFILTRKLQNYEELISDQLRIIQEQNHIIKEWSSQWEIFHRKMQLLFNFQLIGIEDSFGAIKEAISKVRESLGHIVGRKVNSLSLEKTIDNSNEGNYLSHQSKKVMHCAKSVPILTQFHVISQPSQDIFKEEKSSLAHELENHGQMDTFRRLTSIRISQLENQKAVLQNQLQSLSIKNMVMINQNKELKEIVEGLITEMQKLTKGGEGLSFRHF